MRLIFVNKIKSKLNKNLIGIVVYNKKRILPNSLDSNYAVTFRRHVQLDTLGEKSQV